MKRLIYLIQIALLGLTACDEAVVSPKLMDTYPTIYPDYVGVTIPTTIAPLNFSPAGTVYDRIDVRIKGAHGQEIHLNTDRVEWPLRAWRQLLAENRGDSLTVSLALHREGQWYAYRPFPIYVSADSIDYGLAYRKIAPGYEVYSRMGIYERDLASFQENALVENTLVKGMCINCHAFNQANPDHFSLHIRGEHGATWTRINGQEEFLDTKTDQTIAACVYPYWHPSGDYIAYSTNDTRQSFHVVRDERIEVIDLRSDIVVYHPASHELLLCDLLRQEGRFETFPAFSPDGQNLYFCSAEAKAIPAEYKEIRYSLCRIGFNPATGTFSDQVDTLINAAETGKSVSFPRPSYDGRYLMYTLSDYGNFSIWHKEADLWLLDLATGESRPIDEVNSDNTESFHNWSHNSRWFVFSSRRDDGLYTRLYLAHFDENGRAGKPFMLPQPDPATDYDRSTYSYNVPDFISEPTTIDTRQFRQHLISDKRTTLKTR